MKIWCKLGLLWLVMGSWSAPIGARLRAAPLTPAKSSQKSLPLRLQIERITREAQSRVGVAARVLETGESVGFNEGARFSMQSVYKIPIAMALLRQVDKGKLSLDQPIRVQPADFLPPDRYSPLRDANPRGVTLPLREVLRESVSQSDNTASDIVLHMAGGPRAVMSHLRDLGLRDVVVANTERELGQNPSVQHRNWATPQATVALLRALQEGRGLSPQSRALLLGWMKQTPHGAQQLKGLLPKGTAVAHKTGSSGTVSGVTAATNDVGLISLPGGRHLAIAVFVADSKAPKATREKVIARIARAVWDRWK